MQFENIIETHQVLLSETHWIGESLTVNKQRTVYACCLSRRCLKQILVSGRRLGLRSGLSVFWVLESTDQSAGKLLGKKFRWKFCVYTKASWAGDLAWASERLSSTVVLFEYRPHKFALRGLDSFQGYWLKWHTKTYNTHVKPAMYMRTYHKYKYTSSNIYLRASGLFPVFLEH